MGKHRVLNIKGAVLDKKQLENYLEKIASDNIISNKVDKNTYPIPRVKENFEYITNIYNLLNEHIKLGISIHPAGEWILDNFYIIEKTVKTIIKQMPLNKYKNFLGIANGPYKGFARIFVLADEIVAYTDSKITSDSLKDLLSAYQNKKTLNMDEFWNLGLFLQISLIEKIRGNCEKIYVSQMQKYKVENIIERLVENKQKLKFKLPPNKTKLLEPGQIKYPFIEYMSYRLKSYGKKAYSYLEVLENQVDKMGTDINDIIQKEHFDIAVKKISLGNAINTINRINRMNFQEIFEEINQVEEILKSDPAKVYEKMDYITKAHYRREIEKIASKTKISEIYIARKCLELAQKAGEEINQDENIEKLKKTHIGYYLMDNGKNDLLYELTNKRGICKKAKFSIYLIGICICTLVLDIFLTIFLKNQLDYYSENLIINWILGIVVGIFLLIPIEHIVEQILQYLLNKFVQPKLIPKLDLQNGIPEEYSTMVVIPTILNNREKVIELFNKLEVFYIANKSENIYFTLLGDCTSGKKEKEPFDDAIIEEGIKQCNKLNEKYSKNGLDKFNFIYRNRIWNANEECFLGWERKRGLLNQFNEYLIGNLENPFRTNTFEKNNKDKYSKKIKYIITLDCDTELVLNSAFELIGAMAHILNRPVLNNSKTCIKDGYGIMQPRIGIDIDSSRKSNFTKIFAENGGTDSYTNAISDIYQDNFREGIFTGKGIYDLKVFSDVLFNQIPENTVLSHDLLEGCYLRCGLVTDIMLLDGYPTNYNSYKARLHRWIRGDYQIIKWLKNNCFNIVSKFKIFNNILRSQIEIFSMIAIIFISVISIFYKIKTWPFWLILIISNIIPTILEIINRIIFKRDGQKTQKTFTKKINGLKSSLIRGFISISILPDIAYMSLNAICKTIYRMCESKKYLLEWTTAEEAEKNSKTDIFSYYMNMKSNIIFGVLALLLFISQENIIFLIFSILWLVAPALMWKISKIINVKSVELTKQYKQYLLDVGERTWRFFKDNLTEKNNFLPPDNYQEDRKVKTANRTSPTNIGLAMLAVIASYDLKYEKYEYCINMLEKMINTIENLQKWNGHLYNWYDTETLIPITPRYISTVDNGNFIGYLYIIKQFLLETIDKKSDNEKLIKTIDKIIKNTDFSKLYNNQNQLFSIGYNIEENQLTDSYYDLLASEARQASLVAIAKKDVSSKHWYNLGRTLTILNKYKGLISWAGTSFEYLMPNINIPQYAGSLLDESSKFMIMSQIEYANKLDIPWGISESAFNLKDLNNNYQYKAFGIPWLGLKRGLADDIVVSSYGSILALNNSNQVITEEIIKNLQLLENEQMLDKYGFYESIDYTPSRLEKNKKNAPVKTYMAHHQGLIICSINNFFNNKIFQQRFMKNPEMKSVNILLQERMPDNVIITKEKKEKIEKIKYKDYENYCERVYTKLNEPFNRINLISNNDYSIIINQKGQGYSKYKNLMVNRYKETDELKQGIFFYIKNIKTNSIWTSPYWGESAFLNKPNKYLISFTPDKNKFLRIDGKIETTTKITTGINEPVEIRRIELKNNGNSEEIVEITSILEPVLSTIQDDYSHMAFNNLFLKAEYVEDDNIIIMKRKSRNDKNNQIFMGAKLCTQNETIGDYEFEISKEKVFGRGNCEIPEAVKSSKPLSKRVGLTTDPVVTIKRTVKINPKEKVILDLIICVSEDRDFVINKINQFSNSENVKRIFELSRARVEEESKYLGLTGKEIDLYQRILSYVIFKNPLKQEKMIDFKEIYPIENLWKYGISGDLPIILVKIKNVNDIKVVRDIIKAYEYYKIKNVEIDLIILNEEKESYENYVNEAIQECIYNKNLGYLQNVRGGIFVLKNITNEDKKMLEIRSNILFDSHIGNIKSQLDELEELVLENSNFETLEKTINTSMIIKNEQNQNNRIADKCLKFYNEYGGFSNDGKEYYIRINRKNRTPTVWSNVLANENFGSIVTENLGGYTWYKNSKLNRITSFSNNQIVDNSSEAIFIKDEENEHIWSVGANPKPDDNDYYITYGFGYAKYQHTSEGIEQELEIFVPTEDSVKVNILHLKNLQPKKKRIKLLYYIKPVLGEDEIKTNRFIKSEFNKLNNIVLLKNIVNSECNNFAYISSSEKISKVEGNSVSKSKMDFKINKNTNVVICEIPIELEAFENKDISIVLGAEAEILNCQDMAYKYSNVNNCVKEYDKVRRYWSELVNKVQIQTPIDSMNIILNGWAIYQTLSSRILGRTGFYQSGGAFGFRDQLQDTICLKYINPELTKKQIIKHSKHQFVEGDVEHWWHDEINAGIRTRFSDDLLWLPYLVLEYIKFTGDNSILEIETNYLKGDVLSEGTDEKYQKYFESDEKDSIYRHCIKAINKSINFGENGLPKIGSGDWNDGFSTVGNKGKGESVWLGFFLYSILIRFVSICELQNDTENATKYREVAKLLKENLNSAGWDGRWYRRAYMDDGNVLGSIENEECRIDSIAQSWSVISQAGDSEKKHIAMESLENHLVDKENGIIKLLDPPFENGNLEPGYIKGYLPGTRENGGQYTHAAIWVIIAEALLGFGNKACELFKMINPIEHAKTKEQAEKYKVEPYVIPADIYGQGNLVGRGGWTWYTGSSSWYYVAGIEYILGLKIQNNYLSIEPCIPKEWKEYSIQYKFGQSIYNIKVKNENSKNTGVSKFIFNGNPIPEYKVKLIDDGSINEIEVIM